MISIYSSAFNLVKNNFNYKFAIDNFCSMAEEVIIAINTSDDNTEHLLQDMTKDYRNLKIISTNFSYDDPLLDGKIKNSSLQTTTQPIKIGLDMDEYIPLWQKNIWQTISNMLLTDTCSAYMIPSINLYGNYEHYSSITPKWYLHKSGLFRGPVSFARKGDGCVDTSKSDTCELIDSNGNLVQSKATPYDIDSLRTNKFPFVVHTGYVVFEDRLLRNHNFWKKHWEVESGGIAPLHKVHDTIKDFTEHVNRHDLII